MKVEVQKPTVGLNVLHTEMSQERALAGSGLAQHGDMLSAPYVADAKGTPCDMTINHPEAEIESRPFAPRSAPPLEAVPDRSDELFQEMDHLLMVRHSASGSATGAVGQKDGGPGINPGP